MSLFLTFLPLAEKVELPDSRQLCGVSGTYLNQPFLLECMSSDAANKEALFVKVNGVMIVIMNPGFPLPSDTYEEAIQIDRLWPEAKATIDANKSHLIVSVFEKPTSPVELLNAAKAMTLLVAYLSEQLPVLAKLTVEAKSVASPKQMRLEAELLSKDQIPLSWISLQFFNGGTSDNGLQKVITVTNGLKPFIDREIETPAMEGVTGKTAEFLLNLSIYLVRNGLVIEDGDTVGETEEQKIKVFHKQSGLRKDIPVLLVEFSSTEEKAFEPVTAQQQVQSVPLVRRSRKPFGKRNR